MAHRIFIRRCLAILQVLGRLAMGRLTIICHRRRRHQAPSSSPRLRRPAECLRQRNSRIYIPRTRHHHPTIGTSAVSGST